ncbi:hypothetical protein TIFTF001_050833 [Ficus carica]|nr:hypothetical protein TIFTF001_050833 [Ficus carica]
MLAATSPELRCNPTGPRRSPLPHRMQPTHDLSFAASLPSTPQSLQSHRSWRSEEKGNLS